MSDINKYISLNDNDYLSQMNSSELKDLLTLIKNYYISLRDTLGLGNNLSFGVEIEHEEANYYKILNYLNTNYKDWQEEVDASLDDGWEAKSPILRDTKSTWTSLDNICNYINKYAKILCGASSHIHIGTQILGGNITSWYNFLRLWSTYENIIFRFSYGEYLNYRPAIEAYAHTMSKWFWDRANSSMNLDDLIDSLKKLGKFRAVNFRYVDKENLDKEETMNTIEFRCPNATFEASIWQNNLNLFVHILEYAKSPNFNEKIVNDRHKKNEKRYDDLDWYEKINLEEALEFSDLIFSKNIDKLNFLKQYLKTFKNNAVYDYPVSLTKKR